MIGDLIFALIDAEIARQRRAEELTALLGIWFVFALVCAFFSSALRRARGVTAVWGGSLPGCIGISDRLGPESARRVRGGAGIAEGLAKVRECVRPLLWRAIFNRALCAVVLERFLARARLSDDAPDRRLHPGRSAWLQVPHGRGARTLSPRARAPVSIALTSGRKDHRPGLESCLKALQPGNTFVVWKLDRLGRDLKHLVSTVEDLRECGVGLRVLAGASAEIDTGTANGRLIFAIFAVLAEFERELIAERTRAGLAAARARGRQGGRPRKMDRAMLQMAMSAMAARETNAQDLARRLGITTTTLYMYVSVQ